MGATLLATKWRSLVRTLTTVPDGRCAHGLLYLAAVWAGWREQEHRQGTVDTDLSLVNYRHAVGYRRSPGKLAFLVTCSSTGVVCRCSQRWWSAFKLTAPEAVSG